MFIDIQSFNIVFFIYPMTSKTQKSASPFIMFINHIEGLVQFMAIEEFKISRKY